MASKIGAGIQALRWIGLLGSAFWAGVHFVLAAHVVFPKDMLATEIYSTFFAFTASLAIVAAVSFILGMRSLYLPAFIFYLIDFVLLTETRTAPALFIGKVLPVNIYVIESWILDVLLIIVSFLLWRFDKS
ncbi:hypothetical protein [Sulfurisphaera ohwakuensis]|uniref:ABC-type bacteriocin/lantibiotic exporter with double-glycine peptidase domain n=1 Tax=Sulfurisphaera ohwakuensis TaxID=69656 RepID=A0A650CJH7_SULOH|nr:hypothetical protein [Sulfurisphaera ohwakuensis]MBB5255021.1 ABC-type bacteriocin/lantibiotic exporter with double-glycine peptidase domain [Sulfurisphaera ohwakuensis]QGR18014.1 hypothetical protein D1869_13080 [Sulfurisphaera ohwakuensis]